jgi:FlaG/FlaF family flagellin (archaellin)
MYSSRNIKGVSHIVAAMMLIVIAMAVAFVTFLFVMNYVGLSTAKSGKAIEIQSMSIADGSLKVYVQNIGKEAVSFDPAKCIYTNGELKNSTINKTTLLNGETATITVDGFTEEPNSLTVKVTTTDGTSTEARLQ